MSGSAALRWLADRFELARHGDGSNLASMEGLRGVAVFLVFLVHFAGLALPWAPRDDAVAWTLGALEDLGHAGVDLFFVLSGYLIYGSLIGKDRPFVPYMRRRVRRIYPAFLCVFAIYLALALATPGRDRLPAQPAGLAWYLAANLLLLPGILPIEPLITVAWSLSYEIFFYLLLPAVIGALALSRRRWQSRCLLFGAAAAALLLLCGWLTGPMRLSMFLAGILLHEALAHTAWRPAGWLAGCALAAAAAVALLREPGSVGYAERTAALGAAFYLAGLYAFGSARTRRSGWLTWTPLRWLGNMSYSYYLIHGLALKVALLALARLQAPVALHPAVLALLLVLSFAATLPPAALLFLAVERPLSLAVGRTRRFRAATLPGPV